jgi:mRNA-degrading endonuclease RelE of RelBE toxin-antitoxin system
MADYSVSFARSARKELDRLSDGVADRILAKIEALADNPRQTHFTTTNFLERLKLWRKIYAGYPVRRFRHWCYHRRPQA